MTRYHLIIVTFCMGVGLPVLASASSAAAAPLAGAFARMDSNGDGRIAEQEWMDAAKTRFDKLDANHDQALDPDELQQARTKMRETFRERWQQRRGTATP